MDQMTARDDPIRVHCASYAPSVGPLRLFELGQYFIASCPSSILVSLHLASVHPSGLPPSPRYLRPDSMPASDRPALRRAV
jgi:hypothetical protein